MVCCVVQLLFNGTIEVFNHRIIKDYPLSICINVMVVTIYLEGDLKCTSYLHQTTSN